MNFEQARFNMVEQQIRTWEVLDPNVRDQLFAIRREDFVPEAYRNLAFSDVEIPLGHGAVMLAPKIEAHALQALHLKRHERVLEIGTGSGFMAALLAMRAEQVWSVEIVPQLAAQARANLARAGSANVTVTVGDAFAGPRPAAPFDVIVVSGALHMVPGVLLDQLKPHGRMFAIVGEAPAMEAQLVRRVDAGGVRVLNLFETVTAHLVNAPQARTFDF